MFAVSAHQSFHGNTFALPYHKCSLFSTNKERCLYSRKNLRDTPENYEKCESLAQQIFPRLQIGVLVIQSQEVAGLPILETRFLLTVLCMWVQ